MAKLRYIAESQRQAGHFASFGISYIILYVMYLDLLNLHVKKLQTLNANRSMANLLPTNFLSSKPLRQFMWNSISYEIMVTQWRRIEIKFHLEVLPRFLEFTREFSPECYLFISWSTRDKLRFSPSESNVRDRSRGKVVDLRKRIVGGWIVPCLENRKESFAKKITD